MIALTIFSALIWQQVVAEYLYDCTDSVQGDFFRPGDWIHSPDGNPVITVRQIVHGRSLSEPDAIRQDWSKTGLWLVWLSLIGISTIASVVIARKSWLPHISMITDRPSGPASRQQVGFLR